MGPTPWQGRKSQLPARLGAAPRENETCLAGSPPRGLLGRAWLFPFAGAAGLAVGIAAAADPFHDIGLFAFFGSWAALGIALATKTTETTDATASVTSG